MSLFQGFLNITNAINCVPLYSPLLLSFKKVYTEIMYELVFNLCDFFGVLQSNNDKTVKKQTFYKRSTNVPTSNRNEP